MSKEAMNLALEALGQLWLFGDEAAVIANPAIIALREALAEQPAQTDWEAVAADQAMTIALLRAEQPAPEQEPVAWRWLYNGQPDSEKHFSMPGPDAEVISRASACEFLRTVQYLYTSPPAQRTWVGLPKSAFTGMTLQQVSAMQYAEQVLKDENT